MDKNVILVLHTKVKFELFLLGKRAQNTGNPVKKRALCPLVAKKAEGSLGITRKECNME